MRSRLIIPFFFCFCSTAQADVRFEVTFPSESPVTIESSPDRRIMDAHSASRARHIVMSQDANGVFHGYGKLDLDEPSTLQERALRPERIITKDFNQKIAVGQRLTLTTREGPIVTLKRLQ